MSRGAALALAVVVASTGACTRNPATGRIQFGLIDETEEIALGQETDREIVGTLGIYADTPGAAKMVDEIGGGIAKLSERPDLPWTFRVLDTPMPNAFALPGGYVYVTRGLLAHLSSDDELAAVLGHEIGHVTARHGAEQLRKVRAAQRSVGIFRVIDPNLRHIGGLAASAAGLALLKHSRDDEYEADDLGARYVAAAKYDTAALLRVFDVLIDIGGGSKEERVPSWQSTHPDPEARKARLAEKLPDAKASPGSDADYVARIDGLVYGPDPRDGFVTGSTFVHPRSGFRIDLPPRWKARHDRTTLVAFAENERVVFLLGRDAAKTAAEALASFFADGSIGRGETWTGQVGGYSTSSAGFAIDTEEGSRLAGLVAFVDFEGKVVVMIAIAPEADWPRHVDAVARTFASFAALREPALLHVEPMRVRALPVKSETTLRELSKSSPSSVPLEELALLNHVGPDDPIPAGATVKRVAGFDPRAH